MGRKAAGLIIWGLLTSGCHQVTEFENIGNSRISMVSTLDLQVEAVMVLQCQGRAVVCPGPGQLVVISSDGTLRRVNTNAMSVDTSYSIGGSSGTGYNDAILDNHGDLYVLGPGSQVIEVDLGTNTVEDNFTPGQQPLALSPSPTEEKIYFADASDCSIGEVWTYANVNGFRSPMAHQPSDLSVDPEGGRHIVAVTSSDEGYIYGIWLDLSTTARRLTNAFSGSPCSGVVCFGIDSVYAVSCPQWSSDSGYVMLVQGFMVPETSGRCNLPGHPVDMCFIPGASPEGLLFVMNRTGSGRTVVSVMEFSEGYLQPRVIAALDVDGFPRDIESSFYGDHLFVLTSD
ncbi:MAG: hypothetical protein JXR55_03320 [Candidatus Fermentibacteraceae bacterium]|nr:hypothetical protein [Candidatus Fermentibacteraceae bacterium]